jgi:heat shock transcription factor, other eukaryote
MTRTLEEHLLILIPSFLDSSHTDLIRWSDDGRSFIVLDEDEFARTLIPELFKHSNYASFVRQLNMYGFHKTVNITDGSLRQSEKARKGVKPPSMYSHPYFRRNRPDLLWLIQKPTGKVPTKRRRDGNIKDQFDSDDERQYSPGPDGRPHNPSATNPSQDLTQLPRNELAAVRQELQQLQAQQKVISQVITQLKEQNETFYRQATTFQALHERHENSINAILTFLASFYNRNLEGHGAQNLVNMFTNLPQQQHHGSVVEEFNDVPLHPDNRVQRFVKKPQLLLQGPNGNNGFNSELLQPNSAVEPSSARTSNSPVNSESARGNGSNVHPETSRFQSASATTSPAIKDDAPTPNVLNQIPENNDQMMNLINSVNATQASTPNTATPALDIDSFVDQYSNANGQNNFTNQQRDTLAMIRQFGTNAANSALTSTASPNMQDFTNRIEQSAHSLEMLTELQKKQDERVQELNRRLAPMSPNGTIPGVHDSGNYDPFSDLGAPGDYDPNAFVNFDNPSNFEGGDNFDLNWNLESNTGPNQGYNFDDITNDDAELFGINRDAQDSGLTPQDANDGRVESVSSGATSPTDTGDGSGEPGAPSKRQRRQ